MRKNKWRLLVGVMVILGSLWVAGCGKVNMDNFNRIKMGMDYSEVSGILGDADECSSAIGMKNCRWGSEEVHIRIQFIANKVVGFSQKGL